MSIPIPIVDYPPAPQVSLPHLDNLWFQVAGTVCNLTCNHCFISCSPHNHNFEFLDVDTVRKKLEESVPLGVKEYYFTGGEPFLNKDMVSILELTLQYGPATVLTNGTVLKDEWLERLKNAESISQYSLEFRVSIDGFTPGENDPIRGEGTFDRIVNGIRLLANYGFLPIITVTKTKENQEDSELLEGFVRLLKANGYTRPRIKILPILRIGAEEKRHRGYLQDERVTQEMMEDFDPARLLCHNTRIVTNRGVYVCPILIENLDARLGDTLQEARRPYPLRHNACFTCYQYGALCSNASSSFVED